MTVQEVLDQLEALAEVPAAGCDRSLFVRNPSTGESGRVVQPRERLRFVDHFARVLPAPKRLAALKRLLAGGVALCDFAPGEHLFVKDAPLIAHHHAETLGQLHEAVDCPADEPAWLILEGVVEEWRGQLRLATRRPGDLVGELPALQPGHQLTRNSTATAATAVRAVRIDGKRLADAVRDNAGVARAMLASVAFHAAEYADDEGQLHEALDEYFPQGRGLLVPPPYDVGEVTLHLFLARHGGADDRVAAALPSQIKPVSDVYLIGAAQMRDVSSPNISKCFNYDELMVFLPAVVRPFSVPRLHVPFMFPDNIMAILLGREISGLPKLQSSTFVDSDVLESGDTRIMWRRQGRAEFELHFKAAPTLCEGVVSGSWQEVLAALVSESDGVWQGLPGWLRKALLLKSRVPTTSWKRILSPSAAVEGGRIVARGGGNPYEVDCITQTDYRINSITSIEGIEVTHQWQDAEHFPLGAVDLASPVGLKVTLSMTMLPGRTLKDLR